MTWILERRVNIGGNGSSVGEMIAVWKDLSSDAQHPYPKVPVVVCACNASIGGMCGGVMKI